MLLNDWSDWSFHNLCGRHLEGQNTGIKTSLSKFLWIPYNDWSIAIFLVDFMGYYATFLRNHCVCLERIIILDLYWERKIWLWRPSVTSLPLRNSWTHNEWVARRLERRTEYQFYYVKYTNLKKVNWKELIRRYLNREIALTSL